MRENLKISMGQNAATRRKSEGQEGAARAFTKAKAEAMAALRKHEYTVAVDKLEVCLALTGGQDDTLHRILARALALSGQWTDAAEEASPQAEVWPFWGGQASLYAQRASLPPQSYYASSQRAG